MLNMAVDTFPHFAFTSCLFQTTRTHPHGAKQTTGVLQHIECELAQHVKEMGGACSTHGRDKNGTQPFGVEILTEEIAWKS
jgi:hypothetical protein